MAEKKTASVVEVESGFDHSKAEAAAKSFSDEIAQATPAQKKAWAELQAIWKKHVGGAGHKRLGKAFYYAKFS